MIVGIMTIAGLLSGVDIPEEAIVLLVDPYRLITIIMLHIIKLFPNFMIAEHIQHTHVLQQAHIRELDTNTSTELQGGNKNFIKLRMLPYCITN